MDLIKPNDGGLTETPIWGRLENEKLHVFSSASPIYRLPNEILAENFTLAANLLEQTPRESMRWIFLTHVCCLWRGVALQHAILWREIECRNLDRARVFLQRSKSTMVNIRLTYPIIQETGYDVKGIYSTQYMTEFVDLLRAASDRITCLQVDLHSGNIAQMLTLLTFSLPNIRYLHVTAFGSCPGIATVSPKSLTSADGQGSPPLRKLFITLVDIPWYPFLYRSLCSLTLHLQHFGISNRPPTMGAFLDILDACSSTLEDIHLEGSGPTLNYNIAHYLDPTCRITLPALKEFDMTATLMHEDIPHLMAHLILPETTQITLYTIAQRGLFSVLPRIRTRLKSLRVIDELTFECRSSYLHTLTIGGRTSQFSNSSLLHISSTWDGDDELDWVRMVADSFELLQSIFSPHVTSFTFNGDFDSSEILSTADWIRFFSYFSNIEVLELSFPNPFDADEPFSVLSILENAADMSAVGSVTPTFPSPLVCHKLPQFSIESTGRGELDATPMGSDWVLQLFLCLRTRLHHPIPSKLEKLTVGGVGSEWNDKLLRDMETPWPSIAKLVDEIEIRELPD